MTHLRILCISILVSMTSGLASPVFANEIDQYWDSGFQATTTTVLFMIDNSALMEEATSGSTDPTRLDIVKEGILEGIKLLAKQEDSAVNVSIGRFTEIGSDGANTPILFPFTQVETAVTLNGDRIVRDMGIESSADDAMADESSSLTSADDLIDTVLQLDKDEVVLFQTDVVDSNAQYKGQVTLQRSANTWSYHIEYISGVKFLNTLDFSALSCTGDVPTLSVTGGGSVSGQIWTGTAATDDDFIVTLTYTSQYGPSDVTITATDDSPSSNSIVIKGPSCSTGSSATNPQRIGLRFTHVDIPAGAQIESALIKFVSASNSDATTLTIKADNTSSAGDFSSTTIANRISTLTTASSSWTTTEWEIGKVYPCDDGSSACNTDMENADISLVVQEVVNGTWGCGQELSFIITGAAGAQHKIMAYDNATTGYAPILNIEYTLPDGIDDCLYAPRVALISPLEKALERLSAPVSSTAPMYEGFMEAASYLNNELIIVDSTTNISTTLITGHIINGLTRDSNPLYFVSHPDTYLDGILSVTNDVCQEVYTSGSGEKQTMCHEPPVKPEHTIVVGKNNVWPLHDAQHDDDVVDACTNDACSSEEITGKTNTVQPIYSCKGYIVEPSQMMPICVAIKSTDVNGDAVYTAADWDIETNDWAAYKATMISSAIFTYGSDTYTISSAVPGQCLNASTIATYCDDNNKGKVPICHIAQGNQKILPQDPNCSSIIVAHFDHPQYFDSIRQEKYGCDYEPVIQSLPTDLGCTVEGTNCIVIVSGPESQTTSLSGTDFETDLAHLVNANVTTMTIGVNVTEGSTQATLLDAIADAGGSGSARFATDASEMRALVASRVVKCFSNSTAGNGAIFSASVSLDRFDNNNSHNKEVYYAFSQPSAGSLWDGNLKKFYLVGGAVCETNTSPCPIDENLFDDGFGALSVKYSFVTEGGAGILLNSDDRYISTNYPTVQDIAELDITTDTVDATLAGLFDAANNTVILPVTDEDTAVADVKINNAMRGLDMYGVDYPVPSDPTLIRDREWLFADVLHSQAKVVNYTGTDIGVLIATNDGFVHLFDGETLAEKWAFAPHQLLAKQIEYVNRNCGTGSHSCFGVDSTLNILVKDVENDGIDTGASDAVRVFFGLGQGGTGFYALDITDFSATMPTLQWYIDDTTTGFEALGKTLTAPFDIFVDSSYCTGASCDGNVMFLSGGYDDGPDDGVAGFQFGTSAQGKVLYMLDPMASSDSTAKIAEFTTKDGTTDMTYAIVSEVTGIDENENGIVETLYVGNVGGEIIRIDLADGLYQSDNIHLVASLSSMGTDPAILEANERSIFAPIAVVELTIDNQDLNVLAAITGTRPAASENYPVQDKIYVFLENNTGTVIDSSTAVTVTNGDVTNTLHVVDRSDTYDHSTEVTCGSGTVVDCNRLTEANVHGWVLSLGANEMGIGAPIILPDVPEEGMYSLTFNTYNTNTRESRMYMVNLLNGDPVVSKKSDGNFDLHVPVGDTDDKDNARYQDLSNKAIGGAQAIKLKDGTSELLTSDGPISLPATVGINYRLSPANWTQIY